MILDTVVFECGSCVHVQHAPVSALEAAEHEDDHGTLGILAESGQASANV